jgi:hypothetical protein
VTKFLEGNNIGSQKIVFTVKVLPSSDYLRLATYKQHMYQWAIPQIHQRILLSSHEFLFCQNPIYNVKASRELRLPSQDFSLVYRAAGEKAMQVSLAKSREGTSEDVREHIFMDNKPGSKAIEIRRLDTCSLFERCSRQNILPGRYQIDHIVPHSNDISCNSSRLYRYHDTSFL